MGRTPVAPPTATRPVATPPRGTGRPPGGTGAGVRTGRPGTWLGGALTTGTATEAEATAGTGTGVLAPRPAPDVGAAAGPCLPPAGPGRPGTPARPAATCGLGVAPCAACSSADVGGAGMPGARVNFGVPARADADASGPDGVDCPGPDGSGPDGSGSGLVEVEVEVEASGPRPALVNLDGSGAAPDAPSAPGLDEAGLAAVGSDEPASGPDPPDEPSDGSGSRAPAEAAPAEAGADDALPVGSVGSSAGGESPGAPGLCEDSEAGTAARPTTDRPAASSSRGSVSTGVEVPAVPDIACVSVIN